MNTRQAPGNSEKRFRVTYEFIHEQINDGDILDVGERNNFTEYWAKRHPRRVVNTVGDLNFDWKPSQGRKFKTVFCFQVLEHLLNPLYFLTRLKHFTSSDVVFFLSFPSRPKWLWNDEEHFHEYDRLRFEYLCYLSGWKIAEEKPVYLKYFKLGFRPLIRNFIPQTRIYKLQKV